LVKLACGGKEGYQALMYFLLTSNVITPIVFILASYLFIITTILRMCSTQGHLKAFSTCSSHLISVTLYYSSTLYIYLCPQSSYSLDTSKIISTFYTVVFPMLNPMIYSLRNKDVKEALKNSSNKSGLFPSKKRHRLFLSRIFYFKHRCWIYPLKYHVS
jgi:olfactory receptor